MDNMQPIKDAAVKAIEKIIEKIQGYKDERENSNAKIEAEIAGLEAMGVNRHAFKMALKYSEMDENQRKNFDFAYNLVREAIGQPLQPDLFEEPPTSTAADDQDDGRNDDAKNDGGHAEQRPEPDSTDDDWDSEDDD